MLPLLISVFSASLLGSLHCAGMCGGLLAICQPAGGGAGESWVRGHLPYHLGRGISYATLGVIFGALGSWVSFAASFAHVQRIATWAFALIVIAWGVVSLLSAQGVRMPRLFRRRGVGAGGSWRQRIYRSLQPEVLRRTPTGRSFALGLGAIVLPCGWLYAFCLVAAGTASPLYGVAVLLAFWLGTVPALSIVGSAWNAISARLGSALPTASALAVIGAGVLTLVLRAPIDLSAAELPETPVTQTLVEEGEIAPVGCCNE